MSATCCSEPGCQWRTSFPGLARTANLTRGPGRLATRATQTATTAAVELYQDGREVLIRCTPRWRSGLNGPPQSAAPTPVVAGTTIGQVAGPVDASDDKEMPEQLQGPLPRRENRLPDRRLSPRTRRRRRATTATSRVSLLASSRRRTRRTKACPSTPSGCTLSLPTCRPLYGSSSGPTFRSHSSEKVILLRDSTALCL